MSLSYKNSITTFSLLKIAFDPLSPISVFLMLYFISEKYLIIIPLDHNPEEASKTAAILLVFLRLKPPIIQLNFFTQS